MMHSKSPNNLSPSLFFHSLCIRSSLHSTPCRHRPFLGPPAIAVHSIHGGARGEELLHHGGVAVDSRPVQRCPTSGAEGLGDVNVWRAPPRGSPPPTLHCSGRNCNLWSEVREFHVFQNCIASWLNGSHYLLLVFVKITKTANRWNHPQQKIRKRENRFTPNKLSFISTYLEHSQALFHTHSRPIQVANVQEFLSLKNLKMSYDVLWCFTSMSYHRHAENVLSKVDIACGQFVLYPWSDGAPQRCQWMPLCSVALSPHVLSLAKYLTMAFEKIHRIPIPPNCHLSCHSSVHMAHQKSSNNLSPSDPTAVGETAICGVKSVSFIFFKIV